MGMVKAINRMLVGSIPNLNPHSARIRKNEPKKSLFCLLPLHQNAS